MTFLEQQDGGDPAAADLDPRLAEYSDLEWEDESEFVRARPLGLRTLRAALAAVIFGKWRPAQAFAACLMFGFLEAAAARLQGIHIPLIGEAPVQLMLALPYIMTVLLLAGFIGRANPPAAIGEPYVK